MSKKIISLLLAILIFTLVPLSVSAETAVQPRYTYTSYHETNLTIINDVAYCESTLTAYSTATSINMTLTLQKKVLWWWDDQEEWVKSRPDNDIEMSESTTIGSGTYRVKMVARVCAGSSASETVEGYSGEKSN